MSKLISQLKKKLRKELKGCLSDKNIVEIFLIGSSIKGKLKPRDIDIVLIVRDKKKAEDTIYNLSKKYHVEAIKIDDVFKEELFLTLISEGISLKKKSIFEKIKRMLIFSYSLKNLSKIEKVRFAQALYGRNKDGLLYKYNGMELGRGCFAVPITAEYVFKDLMLKFKIKHRIYQILIINR